MGGTVIHTEYMYYNIVINISTRSRDCMRGRTIKRRKLEGLTTVHSVFTPYKNLDRKDPPPNVILFFDKNRASNSDSQRNQGGDEDEPNDI